MGAAMDKGFKVLLETCADVRQGESVLIVADDSSFGIAEKFYQYARRMHEITLVCMSDRTTHGASPTKPVAEAMLASDVIFGVTKFSLFNSIARINACKAGARFVNMADYSEQMLSEGPLFVDFEEQAQVAKLLAARIIGDRAVLTSKAGTNLTARIGGMKVLALTGRSLVKGATSSPPDIECATGPVEGTAQGVLVIDGSIPLPGVGVLREPVVVTVKDGRITGIEGGSQADVFRDKLASFGDERVYTIAEIGIGLNPMSGLSGRMLEDEGAFGTMHIGIGNNLSYGGSCDTNIHIDMIMRRPSFSVDEVALIERGHIVPGA